MDKARIDSPTHHPTHIRQCNAPDQAKRPHGDGEDRLRETFIKERLIFLKLFTLALEDIFKYLSWERKSINIDGTYLNHDIVLISSDSEELKNMLEFQVGLKMNLQKTKILSPDVPQLSVENHTLEVEYGCRVLCLPWTQCQTKQGNQTTEITRRTQLTLAEFGKLGFKDSAMSIISSTWNGDYILRTGNNIWPRNHRVHIKSEIKGKLKSYKKG